MPSTPSSCAIRGSGFFAFLYCMIDVRDVTRSALMRASAEISASVMPSEK
jgi:hypothetical protein